MFPSMGHFRNLHCPYHLEDECKRIYCHFRHVKSTDERKNELTTLFDLEKQICKELKLDKELFDILVNEEDDNVHGKLLNRKLKSAFPGYDNVIDDLHLPESSSKDNFDFDVEKTSADENMKNLINLTEQRFEDVDDTPLDESPLQQFLVEDAKRNLNTEQNNTHDAKEKRHFIKSCLEKIDKKEYIPRPGTIRTRNFARMSENNMEQTKEVKKSPVENHMPLVEINSITNTSLIDAVKQELEAASGNSSDDNSEDFSEVDKILSQMELLKPHLLSLGKNDTKLKNEPVYPDENRVNSNNGSHITSIGCPSITTDDLDTQPYDDLNIELSNVSSRKNHDNITTLSRSNVKHENPENLDDILTQVVTPSLTAAETVAEQNRLKNLFKNTICLNIDQFFDLSDACRVYGTEIFALLEPLLTYLVEKLNPQFNFDKLRQLHAQNISLSSGLPFVTSCDHLRNCFECHSIILCALSKYNVKTADKMTETDNLTSHEIPLRKIEAGLNDITKEMLSLGIPVHNSPSDEQFVSKSLSSSRQSDSNLKSHADEKRSSNEKRHHHDDHHRNRNRESIIEKHKSSNHSKKSSNDKHEKKHHESSKRSSSSSSNKKYKSSSHHNEKQKSSSRETEFATTEDEQDNIKSGSRHKSSVKSRHGGNKSRHDDDSTEDECNINSEVRCKSSSAKRKYSLEKTSVDNDAADDDSVKSYNYKHGIKNSNHSGSDSRKRSSPFTKQHSNEVKRSRLNSASKSDYEKLNKDSVLVISDDSSPDKSDKYESDDALDNDPEPLMNSDSDNYSDIEILCDSATKENISANNKYENNGKVSNNNELCPNLSAKKRISHVTNNYTGVYRKPFVPKKNIPSPSEALFLRTKSSEIDKNANEMLPNTSGNANERLRISHVPNVALMMRAKERIQQNLLQKSNPPLVPSRTVAQTNPRGSSRLAHIVNEPPKSKDIPIHAPNFKPVINSFKANNNIPLPTRQNGLDKLFNVFSKKVPPQLARELALKEEKTIHEKVTITKIYLNSLALAVHRITKEDPAKLVEKISEYPTEINGLSIYDLLSKHTLNFEQLEINGFPLGIKSKPGCCRVSTKAIHYKPLSSKRSGDRFYCSQCRELFEICPETNMPITSNSGCKFHALRPRKERGRAREDMFYPCCNKNISESGCMSAEYHTPDTTDDDCLEGFIETRDAPPGENPKMIYSLDCEMCYTTKGIELTRVTVIGHDCKVKYDSLVKPRNRILDYCTKFSGITEEKLRYVTKTLEDVRAELFNFIFKSTILIGHSLENDLRALKILHYKIVDTSIMYPHRDAPEKKFSLKYLSSNVAQFLIQENEFGHDSEEDALACMKLVWKKIKENVQTYRPRKIIGSPERQKH